MASRWFFFIELRQILERERKELSYTPTPEELRAGIDRLQKLGDWPIILSLSKLLNRDIEEIILTDYNTIFITLLSDSEGARFGRRLNEVYANKK